MGRKKEKASEVRDSRKKNFHKKRLGKEGRVWDHAERKAGWKMDEQFECLQNQQRRTRVCRRATEKRPWRRPGRQTDVSMLWRPLVRLRAPAPLCCALCIPSDSDLTKNKVEEGERPGSQKGAEQQ